MEQGLQTDSILGGPKVTGSDPKEEIAASSLSMFIFAFFFFFAFVTIFAFSKLMEVRRNSA